MLKSSQRLAKRSDILQVYRRGRRKSSPCFSVCCLFLPTEESHAPRIRLAVVVPNKVSKKATERNLVKRRMREVLRKLSFQPIVSADVVVTAHPASKHLTFQEISAILYTLFTQVRLI